MEPALAEEIPAPRLNNKDNMRIRGSFFIILSGSSVRSVCAYHLTRNEYAESIKNGGFWAKTGKRE